MGSIFISCLLIELFSLGSSELSCCSVLGRKKIKAGRKSSNRLKGKASKLKKLTFQ